MPFRNYTKGISLPKTVAFFLMLTMAGLTGIHAAGTAEAKEKTISTRQAEGKIPFPKPASHRGDWLNRHGFNVGMDWIKTKDGEIACFACHVKKDCTACHNTRKPADHSSTWRTLSHGFMAEGNRERCLACHREDYCTRCHSETEPRSHRGNWQAEHCGVCHFEGKFTPEPECAVCHKSADHSWAPHSVNGRVDCLSCHTGG